MRINDIVYFSPNLHLGKLDLNDKEQILKYFPERIKEYYLKPISVLVQNKMAFSAGAIECLLIDALSRYSNSEEGVGKRIMKWCMINLSINQKVSEEFYKFFRCGLLHEAHIKQFGQFSFDANFGSPIQELQGYIIVNPQHLLKSLEDFLDLFISKLDTDTSLYSIFIKRLSEDFSEEITLAK